MERSGTTFAVPAIMSVAVQFAEPWCFVVHASGDVTVDECLAAEADLLSHPKLDAQSRVLVDGREVRTAPTTRELRTIARELHPLTKRGVTTMAIVAATDFVYGVARMFGMFAKAWGLDVRTFRDLDAARHWLAGGPPAC